MSHVFKLFSSIVLLFQFSSKSHGLTFTTDDCNNGRGCFFSPDSCTSSENCDFLITFEATNSTTVLFEVSGKGEWAAVGFSDNKDMADTDLLMCVRGDGSRSGHYYASSTATPQQTTPTPSAIAVIEQAFENGRTKCRVSREINPGLTNFKDLNTSLFLIGGYGPQDGGGGIARHTTTPLSSDDRLRVLEAVQVISDSSSPSKKLILVHGILMAIAWTGFAFVGLFTARYMREVWEPTEIFGKKAWFTVHRLLMTTTVSLTIAGTIVIFVHKGRWSSGDGAHPICGIIAISLAVIQPIMAAFRPAPDAPKRGIFNWTHRLVGFVALVMAVVTIYLGLDRFGLGKPGLYTVITFYIGEFLIFVFEFYLIMSKRNKTKKTDTRDIAMHPPGYEIQQQPEMSPKEAMLRKMMFAFVTLLGFSVTLTIILLLVLRYQGAVDFSEEN
ncbi:ferric-chelate reductase 1-like isoform X2 [Montipora capricornis]|uniref:ferric-chelate reductase 1-like isoform X2 n=1 Tax=Montipora capricornis TaxID=246305 RepID=UPI0035F0FC37